MAREKVEAGPAGTEPASWSMVPSVTKGFDVHVVYHSPTAGHQPTAAVGALTEAQAARYLGIAPRTLWALRKAGRGPASVRIGDRSIRYPVRLLDRWLEEQAAPQAPHEEGGAA